MIEALLFGNVGAMAETGRRCQVLVQRDPMRFDSEALRTALERMSADGWIAYAIAFKAPLVARLVTLAMLPWRLRCVERTIVRGGAQIVGTYGVDPNLDAPFCIYELHSPAAEYADRRLRTRGSAQALRRILARCFVCDPALGGVVVIGKRL